MKLTVIFVAASALCIWSPSAARAQSSPAYITGKDGARLASAVLQKGKPAMFSAVVAPNGGKPAQVHWKAEPEGVLELKEGADGTVAVTALRDWFDEHPSREPTARLIACTPTTCAMLPVTTVPDLDGAWAAIMKVNVFAHTENRDLRFTQDGRRITFDPEPFKDPDPKRIATLRLEGNKVTLVNKGSVLTVFDGEMTDRSFGRGNWASSWGFSGTWTARRK